MEDFFLRKKWPFSCTGELELWDKTKYMYIARIFLRCIENFVASKWANLINFKGNAFIIFRTCSRFSLYYWGTYFYKNFVLYLVHTRKYKWEIRLAWVATICMVVTIVMTRLLIIWANPALLEGHKSKIFLLLE